MYFVYLLLCKDKSIYTGIATDVHRRFKEHQTGTASKYTRARGVVKILYSEKASTRSIALQRELEIKSWPRSKKLSFIAKD